MVTAGAPAAAAAAGLVVLHGRGATAQGAVNLFASATGHGVTVFAPDAERSRWFPRPFDAPREANEPHLTSAVECVGAALDRAGAIGLPPERVVVAGFSQGGCVAAEFARLRPTRYGGVAVLSGALPGEGEPGGESAGAGALDDTPVFLGRGTDDTHVSADQLAATAAIFEDLGGAVSTRSYPGLGHAVAEDELDVIRGLLDDARDAGDAPADD